MSRPGPPKEKAERRRTGVRSVSPVTAWHVASLALAATAEIVSVLVSLGGVRACWRQTRRPEEARRDAIFNEPTAQGAQAAGESEQREKESRVSHNSLNELQPNAFTAKGFKGQLASHRE